MDIASFMQSPNSVHLKIITNTIMDSWKFDTYELENNFEDGYFRKTLVWALREQRP